MNKIARTSRPYTWRPQITREGQFFQWNLANALGAALHDPKGEIPGDPGFTVEGLSNSTWTINHPDLNILETGESPLFLHIKKIHDGKWAVLGENRLSNLLNIETLRTFKTPPGDQSWDIASIARLGANYFLREHKKIKELKQQMSPDQVPGSEPVSSGQDTGPPGGLPGPMGSRAAATLDNLKRARKVARFWDAEYQDQPWYRGARVINDAHGIALAVRVHQAGDRAWRALEAPQGHVAGLPVHLRDRQGWTSPARPGHVASPAERISQIFDPSQEMDRETDVSQKEKHDKNVRKVYRHLLNKKRGRLYSSVRYLAKKLGMTPEELAKALGELIVTDRLDITNKKFKPIPVSRNNKSRSSAMTTDLGLDRGTSQKDQYRSHSLSQRDLFDKTINPDPADFTDPDNAHLKIRKMPDPLLPN